MRSTSFVVEPKIDGLTVILHYQDGIFIQGATRGDGEVGEEITANLRTINAIPLRIPLENANVNAPAKLVVRGEVFITVKDFIALNKRLEESGEKTYLNPRNTAAGSLASAGSYFNRRASTLTCWSMPSSPQVSECQPSQWETLSYLGSLGFPVTRMPVCMERCWTPCRRVKQPS